MAATARSIMKKLLIEATMDAKQLSVRLKMSEKDVPEHLAHLIQTLRNEPYKLVVTPAECIACGFKFGEDKINNPSRCPKCKSERVSKQTFHIEERKVYVRKGLKKQN